ncbi:MAG: VCBS repeat-containing protein [Deltaproteobacteria bacterium]|nr:VCBS repeat-containing protein [Deltaproteobacteria bacterium]
MCLSPAWQIDLPSTYLPFGTTVADVNGDGHEDVLIATDFSGLIGYLGDGAGNFSAMGTFPFAELQVPERIVTGDFDGDGNLDLVVPSFGNDTVVVYLGAGNGTFQPNPVAYPTGQRPTAAAVADFDGDGRLDFAASLEPGNALVFMGYGDGGFATGAPVTTGAWAHIIVAADFNRDGKPDLATIDNSSNTVSEMLGFGDGGFAAPAPFNVGNRPLAMAVGDFNGDGTPDLVVANSADNTLSELIAYGDGGFAPQVVLPVSGQLEEQSVTVGDFNADGIDDFASVDDNFLVSIFPSNAAQTGITVTPAIVIAAGHFDESKPNDDIVVSLGTHYQLQFVLTGCP